MKKRDVVILAIAMIIIIVGIILTFTIGFNKQLRFSDSQKIDIYIESEVELGEIKDIVNEVLGTDNMVQIIEIYHDMITIRAQSISEEEKDTIVEKIKEIYEFEQTAEETTISNVPATRIRDMFKNYIKPFAIAFVLTLIYMMIRYHKKGIIKVCLNTVIIPVLAELVLFSVFVILRTPIGIYTPAIALVVYMLAITYVVSRLEKQPDNQ